MFKLRALQAHLSRLRLGVFKLGFRLIDISLGRNATLVTALRQVIGLLICRDGFIQNNQRFIIAA